DGDALGEGGRLDGLENPGEGVGTRDAVGQLEPFAQPVLVEFAELLHEFVGTRPAEDGGEGHEKDLTEMVQRAASGPRIGNGSEGLETFGKASGIVGLVGVSGHSGKHDTPIYGVPAFYATICAISLM